MPAGLHIVSKASKGKPLRWYVYAWRGGPCIHKAEGPRPKITAALTDLAAEARRNRTPQESGTLTDIITAYRSPSTPEWVNLAKSTKASWSTWHQRILDKFGDVPLEVLNDRRFRGDILDWRDQWISQPRAADLCIQAFSRLLSWGVDRGRLRLNVLAGVKSIYQGNRSELIWEPRHFEAFNSAAPVHLREAVALAAATGIRLGDLAQLPWSAIGETAIIWKTSKSRRSITITVPLLPEARTVMDGIKARHQMEMDARPPKRRKELPNTVLANSRWQAWTPNGLSQQANEVCRSLGFDVHFHDIRGTFVTRLMVEGLSDNQIANIVGWSPQNVAMIRQKYVSSARVVIELGERIARGSVNRV